jgi:hypothetical protein
VRTWDPTKFVMTVGANTLQSFAAGTFIKAAYNEELFMLEVGSDGVSNCRIRNANESGRFEITLLKSSPSNDVLSALALLDRATGQGVVPCQVKDGSGTAVALGQNSWIVKPADLERGKELGDVTWIIETDKLQLIQGGTTDVPQA